MIKVVPTPDDYEDLKDNEVCLAPLGEGRVSIVIRCPQCKEVFLPAGPNHNFNEKTLTLTPSVKHKCGFHKSLKRGIWR